MLSKIRFYKKAYLTTLTAIIIATIAVLSSSHRQESALLMGDYPAFYTLGKIVLESKSEQLYDLELQTKIQNERWSNMQGGVLISFYPPIVAILMTPFAALTPTIGKLIFTIVSLLALFSCYRYLLRQQNSTSNSKLLLLSLILTNPFILIGSVGGQNTSFSIAIACLAIYLLSSSSAKREFMAGLAFSIWLFKPQFALLILPFLLTLKLWKACFGFILGGIIHYLAGVVLLGPDWPIHWLKKISFFASVNYFSNQDIHSSLVGLFQLLNIESGLISQNIAQYLTWPAVAMLTISICIVSARILRRGSISKAELSWLYIASIPIIAPQTQFYDIGITAFALLVICSKHNINMHIALISLVWVFSWISISLRPLLSWLSFPLLTISIFSSCLIILLKVKKRSNDERPQ